MGDHVAERDARAAARAAADSVDLEVNEHGGGAPPPQPHATPAEEQEKGSSSSKNDCQRSIERTALHEDIRRD